jgi:hypothetical protein
MKAAVVMNSVTAAEGIKAKLFKILGDSEPLTSSEIWAKAEVRPADAGVVMCRTSPDAGLCANLFA